MKPVAIVRHAITEGAGYFATFLDAHSIPWQRFALDQGQQRPEAPNPFSGLCLLDGPMSVNDRLLWIKESCTLIRGFVSANLPVIRHCLGVHPMSKALGGQVMPNPAKEIGWSKGYPVHCATTRKWFSEELGRTDSMDVFHWHGETFSLPGAERILGNAFCPKQMFALGPHLAMQCHVEMSATMIDDWCHAWQEEITPMEPLLRSVQTPDQIAAATPDRLPALQQIAFRLYTTRG